MSDANNLDFVPGHPLSPGQNVRAFHVIFEKKPVFFSARILQPYPPLADVYVAEVAGVGTRRILAHPFYHQIESATRQAWFAQLAKDVYFGPGLEVFDALATAKGRASR